MTNLSALFFTVERGQSVGRSFRRPLEPRQARSSEAVRRWLAASYGEMADGTDGLGFAGVYGHERAAFYAAEALIDLVAEFEEGAKSAFLSRYVERGEAGGRKGRRSLAAAVEACALQGIEIWYGSLEEVPARFRPLFSPFTLVYYDLGSGEIRERLVYLHEDFEAAAAKCLLDEPEGPWDPIGLFEGEARSAFSPDEFDDLLEVSDGGERGERGGPIAVVERETEAPAAPRRTPAEVMAEALVKRAIYGLTLTDGGGFTQSLTGTDRENLTRFLAYLDERRPLVVLETQYWEIAEQIARYLAGELNMRLSAIGSYYDIHDRRGGLDQVVFYDDSVFASDYEIDRNTVRVMLRSLAQSRDVGLAIVSNRQSIPLAFQNYTDLEIALPVLVGPVRDEVFATLFGPEAVEDSHLDQWTRYLLPYDLDKVLASGLTGVRAVADLKERVEKRLKRRAASTAPRLEDIHGLGEAKELADQLVADMRLAIAGEIAWSEVDRGMLLVGPPGTGKTMLAKSISREAGIRFIAGSALEWQSAGALDSHLASIRDFFAEARRYAPCIVFIDEFDAIGNRQHHQGRNDYYTTAVVNCVLEELQGFHERDGVVVIAASNEPGKIDPALKRAGRLDQTVTIHRPNVDALSKIYDYHLEPMREQGFVADDIDTEELARVTFGQTGADVEFYVRGARRRARRDRRQITQADLMAEVMRRPLGPSGLERMTEDEIRQTAIHEAGHALIQILGPSKGEDISYVSIVPRPDGSLGFVASFRERVDVTRGDILEMVRVCLAGRAAEESIFGHEQVGAGAGGTTRSDLAQATRLLTRMYCQHGFSRARRLVWLDVEAIESGKQPVPPEVEREIRETLDGQYRAVVKLMSDNRRLLLAIADRLLECQEMTGPEIRAFVAERRRGVIGRLFARR